MVSPTTMEKGLVRASEAKISIIAQVEVSLFLELFAGSGTAAHALMVTIASAGTSARPAQRRGSLASSIKPLVMAARVPDRNHLVGRGFSESGIPVLSPCCWGKNWVTNDFIGAHKSVVESGKYNFEGCKISSHSNQVRQDQGSPWRSCHTKGGKGVMLAAIRDAN